MKLKEYMESKKFKEAINKTYEVKIVRRGTGRKYGNRKKQEKTSNLSSQRDD